MPESKNFSNSFKIPKLNSTPAPRADEARPRVEGERPGMLAGIIACVLAVLGILTIGTIFVPISAVVALVGTMNAISSEDNESLGVNILAWVLIVIGFFTSPLLIGILGLSAFL